MARFSRGRDIPAGHAHVTFVLAVGGGMACILGPMGMRPSELCSFLDIYISCGIYLCYWSVVGGVSPAGKHETYFTTTFYSKVFEEAANMAEARLGVAFQFQVTEEGIIVNVNRNALKFVGRAMVKSAKRRVKGATKAILKRSFPATPATWILLVAALSAARYSEHETTLGVLGKVERGLPW